MAVVFISPKQRQQAFLLGSIFIFLLFLIFVSVVVFFSKPGYVPAPVAVNRPKISLNLSVFDSEQFKNLEPFSEIKMRFTYKTSKNGTMINGLISAVSIEEAKALLDEMGLIVNDLKEAEIGRENPFEPYFEKEEI